MGVILFAVIGAARFTVGAGCASPEEVSSRISMQFLDADPAAYRPRGFSGPQHLMEHPYGDSNHVHYAVVSMWANAIECARKSGNSEQLDRLVRAFDPFFGPRRHLCPTLRHVDFTVFGALPLAVHLARGDARARDMGLAYADLQWARPEPGDRQAHYDDRTYSERLSWWNAGYSDQTRLWIDDAYMIIFLQTQAYRADADMSRIRRSAKEMELYLDRLQLPDGLFHHSPDAPHLWARGNGWMAAGMALLLRYLPPDDPRFGKILGRYRKMMETLLAMQRDDGLWGQLVDDPASWSETSGSAMFAYAFQEGVNSGWIDAGRFSKAASRAYSAIVARMDRFGNVADVCEGTGKKDDRQYYLSRGRVNGDPHGQAALLWLCGAMMDAKLAASKRVATAEKSKDGRLP